MRLKLLTLPLLLSLPFLAGAQTPRLAGPEDFEKGLQAKDIQVLDVRTMGEYQGGHLTHALQADWNNPEQFKDRVSHLDKHKPVYVYCLSGGRSGKAADYLSTQGFDQVVALKGGINAWKQAGKPLENPVPVAQLSKADYLAQVGSKGITLVDWGAEWCAPCREMEPVLQKLGGLAAGRYRIVKMDGGSQTALMGDLKVEALPTFIVYRDGRETWRKQGVCSLEELQAQIR
jgi:rhodanese-related sulfurtransferase